MSALQNQSGSAASSFLDQHAVDEAMKFIQGSWPNQQMNPAQREAWLDILGQLRQGELKTALRGMAGKFRPDPYAVLDIVLQNRRPPLTDWRPEPYEKPSDETRARVAQIILKARKSLGQVDPLTEGVK